MHTDTRWFDRVRASIFLVLIVPVAGILMLWGASQYLPTPTLNISIGDEEGLNEHNEARHLYSFLGWGGAEQAGGKLARRGEQRARFAIPWAFRLGRPLHVEWVMSTWGVDSPMMLHINDTTVELPANNSGWRVYHVRINQRSPIYQRDVYMEWKSSTPQGQGPLLHHVTLRAEDTSNERLITAVQTGIWLALIMLVGYRRFRILHPDQKLNRKDRKDRTAGQGDGHYVPRYIMTQVLIWAGVVLASVLAVLLFYQPQLLPMNALVALGGCMAVVLTWLIPSLRTRLLLWALVLWILATPQILGSWIMDDAFISFRYAKNLVNGIGLTFNAGESVEGYTNFLWTLLMAGFIALGFEPIVTAQFICMALSLAIVLLTYVLAVRWWPSTSGEVWGLLAPMLLVLMPPFLLYTARGSGMETALVTLLTVVAYWCIWRIRHRRSGLIAGIACAAVMMTRPDGVLVLASACLLLVIRDVIKEFPSRTDATSQQTGIETDRVSHRSVLSGIIRYLQTPTQVQAGGGLLVGFALLYAPYFIWRYSYYGYLLPNTFYAKVGATSAQVARGVRYTWDFWMTTGGIWLLVLLCLSLVSPLYTFLNRKGRKEHKDRTAEQFGSDSPGATHDLVLLLWIHLLLTNLYVIAVGGDQFPLGRFFIPVLPAVALLIYAGIGTLWHTMQTSLLRPATGNLIIIATVGGIFVLCLLHIGNGLPASDSRIPGPIWSHHKVAMKNMDMGHWFRLNTPPDTVIATGIAGALPYYSERYVIDMLGLNDTHIAHLDIATMGQGIAGAEKTDTAYILNRQPDYIPASTSWNLQKLERFQRTYRRITIEAPLGGNITLYQRRGIQ